VVKILVGQDDVSPSKPDDYGRTQLFWTAYNRHDRVVKILLKRDDVNPDKPDNNN